MCADNHQPPVPAQNLSSLLIALHKLREVTPARDPALLLFQLSPSCGWLTGVQAPMSRMGKDVLAAWRIFSLSSGPMDV